MKKLNSVTEAAKKTIKENNERLLELKRSLKKGNTVEKVRKEIKGLTKRTEAAKQLIIENNTRILETQDLIERCYKTTLGTASETINSVIKYIDLPNPNI